MTILRIRVSIAVRSHVVLSLITAQPRPSQIAIAGAFVHCYVRLTPQGARRTAIPAANDCTANDCNVPGLQEGADRRRLPPPPPPRRPAITTAPDN